MFFSFFIFGPLQELGNIIIAYREAETSLLKKIKSPYLTDCLFLGLVLLLLPLLFHVFTI